jgi:lactoylglutathione lyase
MEKYTMPRLDHIALQVTDLETSIAFYRDIIGLPFMFEQVDKAHNEAFAFLEVEGGNLELLQCLDPEKCAAPNARIAPQEPYCPHVALAVDDLDATLCGLEEKGIQPLKGPMEIPAQVRWCYLADPDNNILEFVQWLNPDPA